MRAHSRFEELKQAYPTFFNMSFEHFVVAELGNLVKTCLSDDPPIHLKVQCTARSNVLGWSLYDLQLRLWLQHFGPHDLLVTYLDDLAERPLSVLRAIEAHLGLSSHDYGEAMHHTFNPRDQYGWGVKHERPGGRLPTCEGRGVHPWVCSRLRDFYRPSVEALHRLAQRRAISALPASWVLQWGLQA